MTIDHPRCELIFRPFREEALATWLSNTGRQLGDDDELSTCGHEANWAILAKERAGKHVSVFCSIHQFARSVTDMLLEASCDGITPCCHNDPLKLSRWFDRFFMVISEVYVDFTDLIALEENGSTKRIRRMLSPKDDLEYVDNFMGFVNNICKHRGDGIHKCHHIPIVFADDPKPLLYANPISLKNLTFNSASALQYPSIAKVVENLTTSYGAVDAWLREDLDRFDRVCAKYSA